MSQVEEEYAAEGVPQDEMSMESVAEVIESGTSARYENNDISSMVAD